jgi:hypothetical protein
MRKEFPYLTRERFPADWATAEMVKQYLRNHRKYGRHNGRIEPPKTKGKRRRTEDDDVNSVRAAKKPKHIDDLSDTENNEGDAADNDDNQGSDAEDDVEV